MNKSPLSAKLLFMPHSGYTDGMEARYTIEYNPALEFYTCKWESAVKINGLYHVMHHIEEIPTNINHETWVKEKSQEAIGKLNQIYQDYLINKDKVSTH